MSLIEVIQNYTFTLYYQLDFHFPKELKMDCLLIFQLITNRYSFLFRYFLNENIFSRFIYRDFQKFMVVFDFSFVCYYISIEFLLFFHFLPILRVDKHWFNIDCSYDQIINLHFLKMVSLVLMIFYLNIVPLIYRFFKFCS